MTKIKCFITVLFLIFASAQSYGQDEPVFLGDINQEEDGSNPRNMVSTSRYAYFISSNPLGYEVWLTDGKESTTRPFSWFNDRYEITDWKYLVDYIYEYFLIQTVDGIYVSNGIESFSIKISDHGLDAELHVNGEMIFWSEPSSNHNGKQILKARNPLKSTATATLLDGYTLLRFVDLGDQVLIAVEDNDGNRLTFLSDGSQAGTQMFDSSEVLAAVEGLDSYYFSAINDSEDLFQFYSKAKIDDVTTQLSAFDEERMPDYSRHEPDMIIRGDVVYFTRLVEGNWGYSSGLVLHKYANGTVTVVEGNVEIYDIFDFGLTAMALSINNLYLLGFDGNIYHRINHSALITFLPTSTYYHFDGNRLYYFVLDGDDMSLIYSNGFDTKVVWSGTDKWTWQTLNLNYYEERKGIMLGEIDDKVIVPVKESGFATEPFIVDTNFGNGQYLKNINQSTKGSWFIESEEHNGTTYLSEEGKLWRTDGTLENTVEITLASGEEGIIGTPYFLKGFDDNYLASILLSNDEQRRDVLFKIQDNQLVEKWTGNLGLSSATSNVNYLFKVGNDAVFADREIYSIEINNGQFGNLKRPYSEDFIGRIQVSAGEYMPTSRFLNVGDKTILRAAGDASSSNLEPWVINRTTGEAQLLKEINLVRTSFPSDFVQLGDLVYFTASDASASIKFKVYKTDLTPEGTQLYYSDFDEATESDLVDMSNLIKIRDHLYFNSYFSKNQKLLKTDGEGEVKVLDDRSSQSFGTSVQDIDRFGYYLTFNRIGIEQSYDIARNQFVDFNWSSALDTRFEIGNYFFDVNFDDLTRARIYKKNKITGEEEIFYEDPLGLTIIESIGSRLIVSKYAEGFGHEPWAIDVGLQDRLAHLPEMEVRQGESFLPYISDIETADFTYTVDDQSAITQQEPNGWFIAEKYGEYNLAITFPETEIYTASSVDIAVHVVGQLSQSIVFDEIESKSFNDDPFELQATGGASGNPIIFSSSDPSIASVEGRNVTIKKVGTITITANQVGTDDYQDAEPVERTLVITKVQEDITLVDIIDKTYGEDDFTLEVSGTSRVDQVAFSSSDKTVVTLTGTNAEIVGAGQVTLTATIAEDDNYELSTISVQLTVAKAAQQITFDALEGLIYSPGLEKTLVAVGGGSGNPIVFTSSDPAIASIDGSMVTINQAGSVTITANQSGNDNYLDAELIARTLIISNPEENISIIDLPDMTFGDGDFTLEIIGTTRTNEVVFSSSDEEVVKVVGTKAEIVGAGEVTLRASLPANSTFSEATTSVKLEIAKAEQALTFEELGVVTYAPALQKALTATGGASDNPITFTSSDVSIATIVDQGALIIKAGEVSITATQAGNDDYLPTSSTQQLIINKATQSVTFPAIQDQVYGNPTITLEAFASSGADVSYWTDSDIITISEREVGILGAGIVEIGAYQTGTENYFAADTTLQSFEIARAPQDIVFDPLPQPFTFKDTTFELTAVGGNSQNPVVFESLNTDVATISDQELTVSGAGSAVIRASQAGNENYLAAQPLTQDLIVNKATLTLELDDIPELTFGDPPFDLMLQASGSQIPSISSDNQDVITLDGHTLKIMGAGSTILTVTLPESDNYQAAEITQEVTVSKATQEIIFELVEGVIVGDTLHLDATSNSGLAIAYALTGTTAIIQEDNLIILQAGAITITAEQTGDINYQPAASVSRTLIVDAAPTVTSVEVESSINIYPNPAHTELRVEAQSPIGSFRMIDLSGRIWIDSENQFLNSSIDVSQMPQGVYILQFGTEGSQKSMRKILIQR